MLLAAAAGEVATSRALPALSQQYSLQQTNHQLFPEEKTMRRHKQLWAIWSTMVVTLVAWLWLSFNPTAATLQLRPHPQDEVDRKSARQLDSEEDGEWRRQEEGAALLAFRDEADPDGRYLKGWDERWDWCSGKWEGVTCDGEGGRVREVRMRGVNNSMKLQGGIGALAPLSDLRILVMEDVGIGGQLIPPYMQKWGKMWLLSLPGNRFSGALPADMPQLLPRLRRLDLSRNAFSGPIPPTLAISFQLLISLHLHQNLFSAHLPPRFSLQHLVDLSIHHNNLSGTFPLELQLPRLIRFDASYNNLSGPIPLPLRSFPVSSFAANPLLCGPPLPSPCIAARLSNPVHPPVSPLLANGHPPLAFANANRKSSSRLSFGAVIAIILGDVVLLLLLAFTLLLYYYRRNTSASGENSYKPPCSKLLARELNCRPQISGTAEAMGEQKNKQLVFVGVEGNRRFELEELLRASAEMLGKGSLGTAYKALLEDGCAVVVKRLKEGGNEAVGKREFEQHMDVISKLRHHNLVPLRAYYYAREEKLLVYDFMPHGSLYTLLHGSRGRGRVALDWKSRAKIALGAARGVASLHDMNHAHGNIKSSNILVDAHWNARVSDFALLPLMASSMAAREWQGYKAPDLADPKKVSQKTDTYSFGVLLLEILTGKIPAQSLQDEGLDLPRWVQSVVREEWTAEVFDMELMQQRCSNSSEENEMMSMLQVAMSCVAAEPHQRPKMRQVVGMIEKLLGAEEPEEEAEAQLTLFF